MRDEPSELRFAARDVGIAFSQIDWEADVPGIRARQAHLEGRRWAIVEYAVDARRHQWCLDGHAGFVLSGTVEYEFEDGGPPLVVGEGDAFALSTGRAHRGRNRAREPTRLFVIDDPAG
jgi:quercetin dioxygenase-like cupin family protein